MVALSLLIAKIRLHLSVCYCWSPEPTNESLFLITDPLRSLQHCRRLAGIRFCILHTLALILQSDNYAGTTNYKWKKGMDKG